MARGGLGPTRRGRDEQTVVALTVDRDVPHPLEERLDVEVLCNAQRHFEAQREVEEVGAVDAEREPFDGRQEIARLVAVLHRGVGQVVVARLLGPRDEVLRVVEEVLEVEARDEGHRVRETPEVGRDVRADAHARALEDQSDVSDRVQERQVDVAADGEEGGEAVEDLEAEVRVTEDLEKSGVPRVVRVRVALDRRPDLHHLVDGPAQRERSADMVRVVIGLDEVAGEEELSGQLNAETSYCAAGGVDDVEAADRSQVAVMRPEEASELLFVGVDFFVLFVLL